MPNTDVEDFLAHHGVLGMHWGKHLPGRSEDSHNPRPQKRNEAHPDHQEVSTLKRNPTKTLSTSEIKKINDRLKTEEQYRKLNPTKLTHGKKAVLGLVAAAGTATTIYNMSRSPAGKAAISAGKKAVDKIGLRAAETIMTVL